MIPISSYDPPKVLTDELTEISGTVGGVGSVFKGNDDCSIC